MFQTFAILQEGVQQTALTPLLLGGGFGGKKESGQLRFGGRDRPFKKPFAIPKQQDPAKGYAKQTSRTLNAHYFFFQGWQSGWGFCNYVHNKQTITIIV